MPSSQHAFVIRQHVIIKEIQTPGRVQSIQFDADGLAYKISYWHESELKTAWLHGDELIADVSKAPPVDR